MSDEIKASVQLFPFDDSVFNVHVSFDGDAVGEVLTALEYIGDKIKEGLFAIADELSGR